MEPHNSGVSLPDFSAQEMIASNDEVREQVRKDRPVLTMDKRTSLQKQFLFNLCDEVKAVLRRRFGTEVSLGSKLSPLVGVNEPLLVPLQPVLENYPDMEPIFLSIISECPKENVGYALTSMVKTLQIVGKKPFNCNFEAPKEGDVVGGPLAGVTEQWMPVLSKMIINRKK